MSGIEANTIQPTTSTITFTDRWAHFLARWAVNRMSHPVKPGLYALGDPTSDSPVFVTANYKLSFDALRSSLEGMDGYILVLDTEGINVWCAAGKGTFGTDELVHRIETTRLKDAVRHRTLVLPQLSASGVAAHEVKQRSGFKVEYGPVRAAELPKYFRNHQATPEMRQVHFKLGDRLILIPVELVGVLLPMLIAAVALYFLAGYLMSIAVVAAILAGVVLFPILLPYLPTHDFSTKGFILGGLVALPFALVAVFSHNPDTTLWRQISGALTNMLIWPPVTAFVALNFTGSTTFTSRSGVRCEMFKYIPIMAWIFGSGIVLTIVRILVR